LPGEWDPGWWALLVLRRCGLVWNLRLPDQLPPRPELVPTGTAGLPTPATMTAAPVPTPSNALPEVLALFARLVFGRETKGHEACLRWPASLAPERLLRGLCGRRVKLVLDRRAPRMALHYAGRELLGLPALLAAIGQRHAVLGLITLCMLPPMLTIEKLRSALSA
jgi:stearoyl-CoA desaturase (delta-9 desaturase)